MSRLVTSVLLALLITATAMAGERSDGRILELYEDSTGHNLKTRQATIYASGRVREETYNFYTTGPEVHRQRWLPSLSQKQMKRIRAVLSENGFDSLPTTIELEKGIFPDAPFRAIRKYSRSAEHQVQWNSYSDDPKTHQAVLFTAIWSEITAMVGWPTNSATVPAESRGQAKQH
jgi:hypothetical protein